VQTALASDTGGLAERQQGIDNQSPPSVAGYRPDVMELATFLDA
jgi:hypothetical protein